MTGPRAVDAVVFGALGTLFDLDAALAGHLGRLGPEGGAIALLWRQKQREYAWLASVAGPEHWRGFEPLTRAALFTALNWYGGASLDRVEALMAAFRAAPAFADVRPALAALRAAGIATAVLSNAAPAMLAELVAAARLGPLLDHVLAAERVRAFKPDPRAYRLAEDALRLHASRIGYVAAAPWDAHAAAAYGFRTVWLNRINQPVELAVHQSARMAADLATLGELLLS